MLIPKTASQFLSGQNTEQGCTLLPSFNILFIYFYKVGRYDIVTILAYSKHWVLNMLLGDHTQLSIFSWWGEGVNVKWLSFCRKTIFLAATVVCILYTHLHNADEHFRKLLVLIYMKLILMVDSIYINSHNK